MRTVAVLGSLALLVCLAAPARAQFLCPDGSYVARGPCQLAPDGSYVEAGRGVALAPDGSYLREGSTPPRIAPDGSYVPGGTRPITICPDGSYVAGRCVITPGGKYIGK